MKVARPPAVAILVALFTMAIIALATSAGSQDDPEVTDSSGEVSRESHDIMSAWVEDETNDTLTLSMEMVALDAFSPRDDWRTLPTTIYEFYFTIKEEHFCARASIPVHGIFAAFATYGLYEVTYLADGRIDYNLTQDNVQGSYNANTHLIGMTVNKEFTAKPSRGDIMGHMWAAVYFEPRNGEREEVDTAMSYESPGRDYLIKGQYTHYYEVHLRAQNSTVQAMPRVDAVFQITIDSRSDVDISINITNTSLPEGYYVNYSVDMPVAVGAESTANLTLRVSIPGNATNGTNVMFSIRGVWETEDDTEEMTSSLALRIEVRFIPPKKSEEKEGIFALLWQYLIDYRWYVTAVIVLIVVGSMGWYANDARKRKGDQDILEYQAYVESHRQQRELEDG